MASPRRWPLIVTRPPSMPALASAEALAAVPEARPFSSDSETFAAASDREVKSASHVAAAAPRYRPLNWTRPATGAAPAMRNEKTGPGFFEGTFARERALDVVAARLGLDPAELRRRNLARPTDAPYTVATVSEAVSGRGVSFEGEDFGARVLRLDLGSLQRTEERNAILDPQLTFSQPAAVTATAGDRSAVVRWTPPVLDPAHLPTSYTVTAHAGAAASPQSNARGRNVPVRLMISLLSTPPPEPPRFRQSPGLCCPASRRCFRVCRY